MQGSWYGLSVRKVRIEYFVQLSLGAERPNLHTHSDSNCNSNVISFIGEIPGQSCDLSVCNLLRAQLFERSLEKVSICGNQI